MNSTYKSLTKFEDRVAKFNSLSYGYPEMICVILEKGKAKIRN